MFNHFILKFLGCFPFSRCKTFVDLIIVQYSLQFIYKCWELFTLFTKIYTSFFVVVSSFVVLLINHYENSLSLFKLFLIYNDAHRTQGFGCMHANHAACITPTCMPNLQICHPLQTGVSAFVRKCMHTCMCVIACMHGSLYIFVLGSFLNIKMKYNKLINS